MSSIVFIAEIGINHNGEIELAKKLIKASKDAGADYVKFQKRDIDLVYSETQLLDFFENIFYLPPAHYMKVELREENLIKNVSKWWSPSINNDFDQSYSVAKSQLREKFLSSAISSILKQTFDDWELIVIDDGSTDETPLVLQNLRQNDHRIHVLTNQVCEGIARSLNRSAACAKARLLARMDVDDVAYDWSSSFCI